MVSKFAFKAIVGAIAIGIMGLTSGSWFIAVMATLGWVIGEVITRTFEAKGKPSARKRILVSKVAGVTYPEPNTGEDRQAILASLTGCEPCRIVPEPENPHDPRALAVHVATKQGVKHIGFVPRDLAAQIAPYLEGESVMVEILEITGGFQTRDGDTAAYGLRIRIELPDWGIPGQDEADEEYIL